MGNWLLLIPFLLGWQLCRRVLREPDLLTCLAVAPALATSLFLLGVNALLPFLSMKATVALVTGLMLLVALALSRLEAPPAGLIRLSRPVRLVVLALVVFLVAATNLSQNLTPDDDYWIHTPLQGLLSRGGFPVVHPFFSDIKMNGHYGRDLLIAGLSQLTGDDVFQVQFWHTTLCQLSLCLVLFCTVVRFGGSTSAAVLATVFLFFGVNVGGRGGMLDTYQNNNALVYLYTVLFFYLLLTVWRERRLGPAVVAGLVLGNYAVVYETHFGLVCLAAVGGYLAFHRSLGRSGFTWLMAIFLIAAPVALTQGGPITKLAKRLIPGTVHRAPETMSPGELNQHQVVTITFPKEKLFQIQLAYGNYQRISCGYSCAPWLQKLAKIGPGTPYRPIWSWDVLQIHWLPTLLAPLTLCFLIARRSLLGALYWTFGAIAFLVPALVDFGPIYEFEYFRWEFAAGVGFAIALGIALGELWDLARRAHKAVALPVALGLAGVLWLGTLPAQRIFLPRLAQGSGTAPFWLEPTYYWLSRHAGTLGFLPAEIEVAAWLRTHSEPDERVLVNFPDARAESILMESTLGGLSGVRSVGHSLPLPHEPVGTPPYHTAAPARAFWGVPDVAQLRLLGADWIYVRPPLDGSEPRPDRFVDLPEVELAYSHRDALGREYRLFRVTAGEQLHLQPGGGPTAECQVALTPPGGPLRPGVCYPTPVTVELEPARQARQLVYLVTTPGQPPNWLEAVPMSLPREGGRFEMLLPLVAPHVAGEHELALYLGQAGRLRPLEMEPVRLSVSY